MPIPTLYIESSVIGGYHDEPWQRVHTRLLWSLFEADPPKVRFVTGAHTKGELDRGAPQNVHDIYNETFRPDMLVDITDEIRALARAYIRRKDLPPGCFDDALHVAAATVKGVDFLLSWNHRHHTAEKRRAAYNATNRLHGYGPVHIVDPEDFINEHEN